MKILQFFLGLKKLASRAEEIKVNSILKYELHNPWISIVYNPNTLKECKI